MNKKILAVALHALVIAPLAGAASHAHWEYGGHAGPAHWADLDEDFQTCRLGKHQSPIDIRTSTVEKAALEPIAFAYGAGSAQVVNNGHTIQVNLPAGGSIKLDGVEYKLLQFHFHTPSEEKIDGKAYPLVAHLVHKSEDGKLAVVAVLFKSGKENPALKPVFASLPAESGATTALPTPFNPAELLPAAQGYYKFMGSLTTPPCSEEVRWQVLRTPVEISPKQLAAFRQLYKTNARPVQPLNGRVVQASQ